MLIRRSRLGRIAKAWLLSVLAVLWAPSAKAATPDLKSPSLEAARAQRKGKAPILLVVRPRPRETGSSRIGFAGATDPGTTVTVNGRPVAVCATGGFAGAVALKPGKNAIVIQARNEHGVKSKTVEVTRLTEPAPVRLPAQPLRIDDSRPISPREDLELSDGDWLRVSFYGSAGQTASFRIGDEARWLPMRERVANGQSTGFYEGACRIGPADRFDKAPAHCRLTSAGGEKAPKSVEKLAKGRVTAVDARTPRIAEIANEFTALYTASSGRARYGNVLPGTRLAILGRIGDRYKVAVGRSLQAWVDRSDCKILPGGESPGRASVEEIETAVSTRGTTVALTLREALPVLVRESLAPPSLTARIYGAQARLWWMGSDWPDPTVRRVEWEQVESDVVELRADLARAQPWGWDLRREDDALLWSIQGPPHLAPLPGKPLQGLTVIVDAGHGGYDRGAVGSTGLSESAVNLAWAHSLAARLREAGAQAPMTRVDNHFVPLFDRVRFAARHRGDLFVSLHNNAVDSEADPMAKRGTLVLYYHPQSRPLADRIYEQMVALPHHPEPRGVVKADICVVRDLTQMPSVLVEGLFVSHPEEEALLMSGKFLDTLTEAVYKGIVDFLAPLGVNAQERP